MTTHHIVVVGANLAGLSTAHYLLRHTIPALEAINKSTTYKLTLISPSTHAFHKFSAPRTLASPDLIPFDKAFLPIADGFNAYPTDHFTLTLGIANAIDENEKTLIVQLPKSSSTIPVPYSTLIIASGATSTSPLWSYHGGHEATMEAMRKMHTDLPKASSILVGGGGPAGIETAGEIATLYPKITIALLSGGERLLPRLRPDIGQTAESRLSALGVTTIHNVKVTSATEDSSSDNSQQTTLALSDGTSRHVDIYIDATGSRPNTSFLPKSWLNDHGYVLSDAQTMRGPVAHTYAIGDVASYSKGGVSDVFDAVRPLCSSVFVDLSTSDPASQTKNPKQKYYKQATTDMQVIPIGPKGGVGVVFGWKLPSFAVWLIKSRTYFIEKGPGLVSGADYVKA
ncbi:hypothetical protein MMC12_005465 [Toensbergia leucococca]|nr:hypothetical protein [Toensbergia leucococca]